MTPDVTLGISAGPAGRVNTSLPGLVGHVAAQYRLGDVSGWSVLETGYEDCNIDLRARRARVVVKVFSAGRPASVPARTVDIITRVRAAGVRHPALHADAGGGYVHGYDGHYLVVMDFAPGRSFFETGRPPSEAELGKVLQQAALIHGIDAHPEPVFDPLPERMEAVARMYSGLAPVPLSSQEDAALDAFGSAAAAMELLGGLHQWQQGNRGPETDSLIVVGTAGLRDYG